MYRDCIYEINAIFTFYTVYIYIHYKLEMRTPVLKMHKKIMPSKYVLIFVQHLDGLLWNR